MPCSLHPYIWLRGYGSDIQKSPWEADVQPLKKFSRIQVSQSSFRTCARWVPSKWKVLYLNPISQHSFKWWHKVPKIWADWRGQQWIVGHSLSDINYPDEGWPDLRYLVQVQPTSIQIQNKLSGYLHFAISPTVTTLGYSCHYNSTGMVQELRFSKMDEFSPEWILYQNNCSLDGLR